jgi:DNA-binding winged helix-turn-helix (wHTH) protein
MVRPSDPPAIIKFGRFVILPHRRQLVADGRPIRLGGRGFDLLLALIEAPGAVVGKAELLNRAWPGRIVEENRLQSEIWALRKALGADCDLIQTVAGRGYQFTGEIHDLGSGVNAPQVAPPLAVPASPSPATNPSQNVSEASGREATLSEVTDRVIQRASSEKSDLCNTSFNGRYKHAMAAVGITAIVVLGLGLAYEQGFSHSVQFDSVSHSSAIGLVRRGLTWIPPLPLLASVSISWLLSKVRTVAAPWALIVGSVLFGLLSLSATKVIYLKDLDVYAVCLLGFLACLVIMLQASARRLSRALVLGAVAVSTLCAAGLAGVAEGSEVKRSPDLHEIHLRGEESSVPISLLRTYDDGILVVMPTVGVGGQYRDEVTFLPSSRLCNLSEFHLEPSKDNMCS